VASLCTVYHLMERGEVYVSGQFVYIH
jgi:hypothetical protein